MMSEKQSLGQATTLPYPAVVVPFFLFGVSIWLGMAYAITNSLAMLRK